MNAILLLVIGRLIIIFCNAVEIEVHVKKIRLDIRIKMLLKRVNKSQSLFFTNKLVETEIRIKKIQLLASFHQTYV